MSINIMIPENPKAAKVLRQPGADKAAFRQVAMGSKRRAYALQQDLKNGLFR